MYTGGSSFNTAQRTDKRNVSSRHRYEPDNIIEQRSGSSMPTKMEMADMFAKLEQSIKADMVVIHGDLGQILTQVEGTGERLDRHSQAIIELRKQMKSIQLAQRKMLYR